MNETLEGFNALLSQVEGNEPARLRIARRMKSAGYDEDARAIAEQAWRNAPDDPEVYTLSRRLLSSYVPHWHFALTRDAARNQAYDAAIRRAIRPGCRVLEIGAGTGLLAMMAARAGAAEVISCEANPAAAAAAERIVAQNGYADRVKIVAKHSDDLKIGEDLPGPADILVSEIISNNLFSELAVPAIEAARSRLLTEEAVIIPASVSARIALAEGPAPHPMGNDTGFDLSLFNMFEPVSKGMQVGKRDLKLRSQPADIFTVDFQNETYAPPKRASATLQSGGGRVNGIAQWLHLRMDAEDEYENRPSPGAYSCWGVVFHPLARALDTRPGDTVRICGAHDRTMLDLWAEDG